MVVELVTIAVVILSAAAELWHTHRIKRLAPLAFGPKRRPALWVFLAPVLKIAAIGLLAWGLMSLILAVKPKVYQAKAVDEDEIRHIVIVLDVSPSMKLADAGPEMNETRSKRAYDVMESFFKRVSMEQMRLSLIAVYNGAKPVIVDTKDADVVRNFLDGLDMYQAFDTGKTKLFSGLEEAAKIAKPWKPRSTTVVLLSDGDTVPATGIPKMPASVDHVLVVGFGDSRAGKFIDGRQSRQDASTLRQIALRLGGEFHDGNLKHLPSDVLAELTQIEGESPFDKLTRREYALIACATGTLILSLLPLALHLFGTSWRPGTRVEPIRPK
ncbi:MAG: Ca-activated chloride channel family protein [Verrucomicrobiales bacterium]|jgi:Ca-activated chloride channel family protein